MDTREAIKAEFMKEYAQKDFRLITVKALCGDAGRPDYVLFLFRQHGRCVSRGGE